MAGSYYQHHALVVWDGHPYCAQLLLLRVGVDSVDRMRCSHAGLMNGHRSRIHVGPTRTAVLVLVGPY
jgi:hypothetical protein